MDAVLNIHKPTGITSYDVVRRMKRLMPSVKVGHGGTLDPFAEGVLLILVGRATKKMPDLLQNRKQYRAVLKLGQATRSGDPTTPVCAEQPVPVITDQMLRSVTGQFSGELWQTPPAFSAKKVGGRPAYLAARRGEEVPLAPRKIIIEKLALHALSQDHLQIDVVCSSGTYIRVLGEDIARALGSVGHLVALQRLRIGDYGIENAIPLTEIETRLNLTGNGFSGNGDVH